MKTLLATAAVLIFSGSVAWAQDAENGKRLFMKIGCYECHGTMGQGGTGPRLTPPAIALATLTAYVRKPAGMPPYSAKIVSDAELADIRAYLATVPAPPPVKSIPLLNQ